MFFKSKKAKEQKENEERLRRINGFEVRYVTKRDTGHYGESIIGKDCVIHIIKNVFTILCDKESIFTHSLEGLQGSELMSLDGIILNYTDEKTKEEVEVIAYYKYHRK